uniref:Bcl-2 Bcl-2 homology region 1-3 domain-containing protein n=1 Tax=Eptatretus burgeri TaxID=7764 RepID=A0A8C4WVW0_EPTBU
MKDAECQTERAITDVTTNSTKEGFIGFITEVVNCTAQAWSRSEKINIISPVTFKHLGWEEFTFKVINKIFNQSIHAQQSSFLSATLSVTKAYMIHHVYPDKQRVHTPEADVLCQIGDELLSKHEKAFSGMVRKLKKEHSTINGRFAALRLRKVAEEMFSDREVNWGRIVALIVFCAVFSRDLNDQGPAEEEIDLMVQEVAKFIVEHDGWIRQEGGWVSVHGTAARVRGSWCSGVLGMLSNLVSATCLKKYFLSFCCTFSLKLYSG